MHTKAITHWSQEEIDYLTKNYGTLTAKEIGDHLQKPVQNIRTKAWKLKVNKVNYSEWTEQEIQLLRDNYPDKTNKELLTIFPTRSWDKIKKKANVIGLIRNQANPHLIQGKCQKLLLETNEIYYWMGFLLADGHFSKQNRLNCRLAIKDLSHLQKIALLLETKTFINTRKSKVLHPNHQDTVGLSVMDNYNINLIKRKFDINNNKTENPPSTIFYNSLPDNLFISLLIGFIDGDGCIQFQTGRKDCSITIKLHNSWLNFLNIFKSRLEKILQITIPQARINNAGYAFITFSNFKICRYLKKFAIDNALPVLKRKWDLIDENRINRDERAAEIRPLIQQEIQNELSVKEIIQKLGVTRGQVSVVKYRT